MPDTSPNFTGRAGFSSRFVPKETLADWKTPLRRLCGYLLEQKRALVLVFGCALVTTAATIVGTRLNGYMVDRFISAGDLQGLALVCLLMGGMYLISALTSYGQNHIMIGVAQTIAATLRRQLFAQVQRLPLAYFDTHDSGDLMSRLTNDIDNINTAMSQSVVQFFSSILSAGGMLAAMLLLSPFLTLVGLAVIPFTFFVSRTIAGRAQRYFTQLQERSGILNGYIEEIVSGQKVQKLFCREPVVIHQFNELDANMVQAAFRAQALSGVIGPCNNLVNNSAYLVVAVAGGLLAIGGNSSITIGVIFSFLLYMRGFTNPINNILNLANTLQLALASAGRVFEVMDQPPETDAPAARTLQTLAGRVEMRQVSFSYLPGKPILQDVSLCASPGQTVAIVGPTGAGKTTIINLLTRFYDINAGCILLDGQDLTTFTRSSLRCKVAVVLQDTFLFSRTVRENIRCGRLDATDAEVEAAARAARAHEFILHLPEGYDTVLADNGQNLSQGQRQMLGIARAMLSRASVLILDEATSSIDTCTELGIQSALLKLMQGKTCFVIAHRLSTIQSADNILVIDNGRVVEQGTHLQLLHVGSAYAGLYYSQFSTGLGL